jgi:hypothetical protein
MVINLISYNCLLVSVEVIFSEENYFNNVFPSFYSMFCSANLSSTEVANKKL